MLSEHSCPVTVYRQDANALAGTLPPLDLAYLDPPYNQHPYGSNYFMLNLLTDYRVPERSAGSPVFRRTGINPPTTAGPKRPVPWKPCAGICRQNTC